MHRRQRLVLPRPVFDRVATWLSAPPGPPAWALGCAVRQRCAERDDWLCSRVMPSAASGHHPVGTVPHPPWTESAAPGAALFLMYLAAESDTPPGGAQQWDRWLAQRRPGYRSLSSDPDPAVAVLWLSTRAASAAVRMQGRWRVLDELHLPGAGMLTLPLVSDPNEPNAALPSTEPTVRYSRQAGAMGWPALQRLQHATVAVIGQGRTGSPLATTLVRMGASVLLLDPDQVDWHNLDGDVLPQHEGLQKVDAVARQLRLLLRPGAVADPRSLDAGSPACGALLTGVQAVVTCVDHPRPRIWAAAWCAALLKPHLDIGLSLGADSAGANIRLALPGEGCLCCHGGFADAQRLPVSEATDLHRPDADFRRHRIGSSRNWGVACAHLGGRLLELLWAGRVSQSVFRRVSEDAQGRVSVTDLPIAMNRQDCPLCGRLQGVGRHGVHPEVVYAAAQWAQLI